MEWAVRLLCCCCCIKVSNDRVQSSGLQVWGRLSALSFLLTGSVHWNPNWGAGTHRTAKWGADGGEVCWLENEKEGVVVLSGFKIRCSLWRCTFKTPKLHRRLRSPLNAIDFARLPDETYFYKKKPNSSSSGLLDCVCVYSVSFAGCFHSNHRRCIRTWCSQGWCHSLVCGLHFWSLSLAFWWSPSWFFWARSCPYFEERVDINHHIFILSDSLARPAAYHASKTVSCY